MMSRKRNDRLPVFEASELGRPLEICLMMLSLLLLPTIFIVDYFLFGVSRTFLEVVFILYKGGGEQARSAVLLMICILGGGFALLIFKVYYLSAFIQKVQAIKFASLRQAFVRWGYSTGGFMLGAMGFAGFLGLLIFVLFYSYFPDAAVGIFTSNY
jgi:hypothetical protein